MGKIMRKQHELKRVEDLKSKVKEMTEQPRTAFLPYIQMLLARVGGEWGTRITLTPANEGLFVRTAKLWHCDFLARVRSLIVVF